MKLDVKNPVPLHVQLRELLEKEILAGKFRDKIPSERELMYQFSVSRNTVREAISALVHEGILEKRHGRGTFVSVKPVEEWLGHLSSFNETVEKLGMVPRFKPLYYGIEASPQGICNILEVDRFYIIKRQLLANDIPVALKKQYYPLEIGEELVKHDLHKAAFYDILQSRMGIKLAEADQSITGGEATVEEAQQLNIPASKSVLRIERVIYDTEGKPLEYMEGCYRTDMYSFRIKMSRQNN